MSSTQNASGQAPAPASRHLSDPISYPPVYGTSQWTHSAVGVNTLRESSAPRDNSDPSQFETIKTYNDAIKTAPSIGRSNLRWAIAPGSLKHMDRVLDSAQLQPQVGSNGQTLLGPNGQGGPGYNTQLPLMSVPNGAAIQGDYGIIGPNTNAPNGIPDWLWTRKVVGINQQLLDIPYGSILRGAFQNVPNRPQALNWNVQQPGQPWVPSAAAANYATLPR